MARKIQFRRGIAATWTSTNPTLAIGEFGLETDTGRGKVGTGVTAWVSLPYLDAGAVAHIADTVAAHTAGAIAFTPAGTIAATDLQAAVVEVATDAAAATATVAGDLSTLSSATSDALALKAALASPALTGTPTAPTAVTATSTTQLATTAFVQQERAAQAATDSSRLLSATPGTVGQIPTVADEDPYTIGWGSFAPASMMAKEIAAGGLGNLVVWDTFDRADVTLADANSLADSGGAWEMINETSARLAIVNGRVSGSTASTTTRTMYYQTLATAVQIEATVAATDATKEAISIVTKVVDADNYIGVTLKPASLDIAGRIGGTQATKATAAITWDGSPVRLLVWVRDNVITAQVRNVVVAHTLSGGDSTALAAGASNHGFGGLRAYDGWLDDLVISAEPT